MLQPQVPDIQTTAIRHRKHRHTHVSDCDRNAGNQYNSRNESIANQMNNFSTGTTQSSGSTTSVRTAVHYNNQQLGNQSEQYFSNPVDRLLFRLKQNIRNVLLRFILGSIMICLFSAVIYAGPLAIAFCILFIQIMCFHEIISLGHIACKASNIPFSRWLSWYFLLTSDFYLFGESIAEYFGRLLAKNDFGQSFLNYHLLVSYSMYIAGFVAFVVNLKKRLYTKQFIMFSITHITLLMIVIQSHMMIKSMLQGIVWFLLPALLIICNDSSAYFFGFFFGQTPLIRVSPKKTWEGFVCGAITTVLVGFVASALFARYPYMVCPVRYYEGDDSFTNHCEPTLLFSLKTYQFGIPFGLQKLFGKEQFSFKIYPFQLHSVFLSLFASLISPFSGFFASGYKRLLKKKDFGDSIPGHGGFMDRFDCQGSMGTFTYVWIITFVRAANPEKLFKAFLSLDNESRSQFLRMLDAI